MKRNVKKQLAFSEQGRSRKLAGLASTEVHPLPSLLYKTEKNSNGYCAAASKELLPNSCGGICKLAVNKNSPVTFKTVFIFYYSELFRTFGY